MHNEQKYNSSFSLVTFPLTTYLSHQSVSANNKKKNKSTFAKSANKKRTRVFNKRAIQLEK